MMSPFKSMLLGLLAAGAVLAAAPPDTPDTKKGTTRLESLWSDLGSSDESRASRALLTLASTPKETTALLKERLKPVKVDAAQVKKWLKQLDDEEFDKRESATRELEYLDRFVKSHLEKALESETSSEVKKRINDLLKRLPGAEKEKIPQLAGRNVQVSTRNGQIEIVIDGKKLDLAAMAKQAPAPAPNSQWVRAARAVALLESLATAESKAILKTLADGESGARPTDEAKSALERLQKQK
jgi:hypothetical protein